MNQPQLTEQSPICGECGAQGVRIARIHKGIRYCPTCYKRLFKRKLCPGCGNFARLSVRQFADVCRACERLKPCVRCHRTGRKIGRLTPDGPACNSCAFYFREPEPCEACGKLSRRLSRKASLGHGLRVCNRCARSDHRSCQACLHHRPLTRSPDGLELCAVCLEKGEIPCPKCHQPMPAGCGRRCRTCYWTEKAAKRIETDSGAFSSPALTGHFQAFGEWLIQTVGGQKGALHIHKYLEFFLEIERNWNDILDYESLLGHFGAGTLRRFQLPMRWMAETGLVRPEAAAREADSDQRRIEANLGKFRQGSPEHTILNGYYKHLTQRVKAGKTSLRTVRLAVSPAASLLVFAGVMDCMPPNQKALDGFLLQSPGQRAALSGFVRYLRERHGAGMTLPKKDPNRTHRKRHKKLEAEIMTFMGEGANDHRREQRYLCLALAYFHDLPLKTGRSIRAENVTVDEKGMTVRIAGGSHWIPHLNPS